MAKKIDDVFSDHSVGLTEQEKLDIEAEARKEVLQALKESEKERFKERAKERIQAEMLFRTAKTAKGEDLVTVDLLLASHPKFIILDGVVYHSGKKHTVTRPVAQVLTDQMWRGWEQEAARVEPEQRKNLKAQRAFVLNYEGLRQVG